MTALTCKRARQRLLTVRLKQFFHVFFCLTSPQTLTSNQWLQYGLPFIEPKSLSVQVNGQIPCLMLLTFTFEVTSVHPERASSINFGIALRNWSSQSKPFLNIPKHGCTQERFFFFKKILCLVFVWLKNYFLLFHYILWMKTITSPLP